MATLIYFATASLNGYITDERGKFGWAEPDDEVHGFVNDLFRDVGTYLYRRRMYETMRGWETDPGFAEARPFCATSPGSGSGPTRSSTPPRWRGSRRSGRPWSAPSICTSGTRRAWRRA